MSCAKVKHHLPQKFGVMRFHFERRNQVANLVDLGHCFSNCFAGPEAAYWQKYPLTAVNSCLAGPNICQVKPASLNTATSFPRLRHPRRYFDLITKEKTTYTYVSARPAFFVTTNTAERHVRRVHDIQQDHLSLGDNDEQACAVCLAKELL